MKDQMLKLVRATGALGDDTALTDDDLMVLAAAGRTDAFEILVNRHYAGACAAAVQYMGDEAQGRDVAQETFLSLWTRRKQYSSCGKFKSYLFTVLFNHCRMYLRKQKADARRSDSFFADCTILEDEPEIPLDTFMKMEQMRRLQQKLATLPDKQRKVLICRYGQNMSMAETAETLNVPINTVKVQAARALKRLYEKMKGKSS